MGYGLAPPVRSGARVGGEMALRVVIADDSLLIREGVARVLADAGLRWSAGPATPTS